MPGYVNISTMAKNTCKFLRTVDSAGEACYMCSLGFFECQFIENPSWLPPGEVGCSIHEAFKAKEEGRG